MTLKSVLVSAILVLHASTGYASVKSYFNHNSRTSYQDPYRGITRKGDNLEKIILDEIKTARRSVFVAVQELRLPLIAKALVEKHKAGVDVRVILENDYNFDVRAPRTRRETPGNEHDAERSAELKAFVDLNKNGRFEAEELEARDAIYMLKTAGVPIMDDTFGGTRGSGLMHHKFAVIDDQTTIVSTANFTMSCVHGDVLSRSSVGNANSLMVVKAAAFADIFTDEFTLMWGNGKIGNFGQRKSYRGAKSVTVQGSRLTVQFSPTPARHGWENSVNGLIGKHLAKASSTVKGALFVFSDQNLSNILQTRNSAGVDVGFIVESKFAYRPYSELLDMLGLEMLDTGCQPEEHNNPWKKPIKEVGMSNSNSSDVLHHKYAVVDNKTVIMGSQNWSDAANYQNDETLVVVESPTISDAYSREYARVKAASVLGASERVKEQIRTQQEACDRRR